MFDTHAIARQLSRAGLTPRRADAIADAVRQAAEHGDYAPVRNLSPSPPKVDLAGLEARLTWRFAGAMLAQTLAIPGGVLATLRPLE